MKQYEVTKKAMKNLTTKQRIIWISYTEEERKEKKKKKEYSLLVNILTQDPQIHTYNTPEDSLLKPDWVTVLRAQTSSMARNRARCLIIPKRLV